MAVHWKNFLWCIFAALIAAFLGVYLSFELRGTALLTSLVFCIGLWTTGAVPKWLTSLLLLSAFSLISTTPLNKIFQFPLSENFVMILFSYLFSQGLQNSHIFDFLLPVLQRKIRGTFTLALSIFLCSFCMIWIIPQPFARIIILLQLYQALFQVWELQEETSQILCLSIVNSSIMINCAFLRGDIILNSALVQISGLPMTEVVWMDQMLLPTLAFYGAGMALFFLIFRKNLLKPAAQAKCCQVFTRPGKNYSVFPASVICVLTVLLWLTETWTGIPAAGTVLAATAAMVAFGYLKWKDLKCIDIGSLIFLSAAFSIGPVMMDSGIAQKIFDILLPLLPRDFSLAFVMLLIIFCMLLHLLLGSCVTTLSIMIPGITLLCQRGNGLPILPVMFIAFLSIACQYLLPLHNVSVMVGAGKGGYSDRTVLLGGTAMTVCATIAIPIFYGGYWYLRGFL